jgi:hypothetical protein
MPNENPIKLKSTGEYPDFSIPADLADETLRITTKTELTKEGWQLDLIHALSVDGKPQDFDPTPDIVKQKLGKCSALAGRKLALVSIATRINNGAEGKPCKVKYSIRLEAGSTLIDETEYSITSTEKNPAHFYTKITLKLSS